MKARLVFWHKARLQNRYALEMEVYEIGKSSKYKDGVRYSMILIDLSTERRALMDNHHPKGHHFHLDGTEFSYTFVTVDRLIEDFKKLVLEHLEVKI